MKKFLTAAFALLAVTTLLSAAPKGKKNGPKIQKKDPITIFDPATLSAAPEGTELVERDGKKYVKIMCDGYNSLFSIAAIELKGYNRFCCEIYSDGISDKYQYCVKLADAGFADIASMQAMPLPAEPTLVRVGHEVKQSWNTLSKTDKAEVCQCFVQDSENGWNPVKGKVALYIGKIYAE